MHSATWQTPVIAGITFMIICYFIVINVLFDNTIANDNFRQLAPQVNGKHETFPEDIGFHGETRKGGPSSLRNSNLMNGATVPYIASYKVDGQPEGETIEHYWGALSPYFVSDGFGIEEKALPETCQVKQVHVLSRHGSRYPTSGSPLVGFAQKLKTTKFKATGALRFLNEWKYDLGAAILVPIGKQQLYDQGVLMAMQYGDLMQSEKKLVYRTTSQTRMTESALAFLEGAYGGQDWRKHANLELIIEALGYNNTLASYLACPNSNKNMLGSKNRRVWEEQYLADKTAQFAKLIDGFEWTIRDTVNLQLLCPYETVAKGYSQFCELFTWQEWLDFAYAESMWFEQNCAFGAPTGRAQGIGWVNELIRRIEKTEFDPKVQSSENATLDANPIFFPLDQNIYVDFTHDSIISSVTAALGFKQFSKPMPSSGPKEGEKYYSTSQITPFAARLVVEVIACDGDEYIHFLLNQRTLPLAEFHGLHANDGWIKLSDWLDFMRSRNELADFTHACFGEYPIKDEYDDGRP